MTDPAQAARRVLALAAAQCGLAALLVVATRLLPGLPTPPVHLGLGVLALAFFVSEWSTADINVRDQVISVSVVEVPAAYALFLADPLTFVVARAIGSGLTQLRRDRSMSRWVFNSTLFALDAAVATAVLRALYSAFVPTGAALWLTGLAALVAGQLASAVAIGIAMTVVSGRASLDRSLRAIWASTPFLLTLGGAGVLGALLAFHTADALAIGIALTAVTWLLLRTFGVLVRRFDTLTQFQAHTAELQSVTVADEAAELAVAALHELTGATYAEVLLPGIAGRPHASARARVRGFERIAVTTPLAPTTTTGQLDADAVGDRPVGAANLHVPLCVDEEAVGYLLAGFGHRLRDPGATRQTMQTIARQVESSLRRFALTADLHRELAAKAHRSLHDPLTELPNRAHLRALLDAALGGDRHDDVGLAVLLVDLDNFRAINDTLGHDSGDHVLRIVGSRIARVLRSGDAVARLGADVFAVLAHRVPSDVCAVEVAGRLRDALMDPIEHDGLRLDVRASVGIARAPVHGSDATALLRCADTALARAKEHGNEIEVYVTDNDSNTRRRLQVAAELRTAAADGRVVVHYQPKVDIRTGEVCGIEALARWNDPVLGFVSPGEFVPVAEQTGAIVDVTHAVLDQACRDVRRLRDAGHRLKVAVNVSTRMLRDHGIVARIDRSLARHRVPPDAVVAEITESVLLHGARADEVLAGIRELGVMLSIDDYGTGYSSLGYLQRLCASELKIDRSFLMGICDDPGAGLIVQSTIDLAHALDMSVVAEGVEDVATLDVLARMGCDVQQGWLVSRALPFDDLLAWLEALPARRWTPARTA